MRKSFITISLCLVLIASCLLYLLISRETIGLPQDKLSGYILFEVRLPRLLLALLTGFILSVTGYVFQLLFNNGLADSFSLGIASGASFGSAVALLAGLEAFIGGLTFSLLTLAAVVLLTEFNFKGNRKLGMVLFGMFINFFFSSALYGLMMVFPDKASLLTAYLFGTIGGAEWTDLFILLPLTILCAGVIFLSVRPLAILAGGETIAKGVGVHTTFYLYMLLITSSLLTAVLISETGIIGFVGLVIPHVFKYHSISLKYKLVWTSLFGSSVVILSDFIGSYILYPMQIPVSIILSLLGLPALIIVMKTMKKTIEGEH